MLYCARLTFVYLPASYKFPGAPIASSFAFVENVLEGCDLDGLILRSGAL